MEGEKTGCKKFLYTAKWIVRIVCAVMGLALMAIGAYIDSVAGRMSISKDSITLGIMGFYCMIFGILIMLAEARSQKTLFVLHFFMFLNTYIGRGVFYIFIGILTFPINVNDKSWGVIIGSILVAGGGLNLVLFPFFCGQKSNNQKQDEKRGSNKYAPESPAPAAQTPSSNPFDGGEGGGSAVLSSNSSV